MPKTSLTILVVDDNEAHRYALRRTLEHRGYAVIEACDGLETLERVKQKPDLILLDVHMPGLDGFSVMQALKSDDELKSIPVVIITATALATQDKAMRMGASAFLTHPVDPEMLETIIQGSIARSKG
jgi:CheY-like chemotaxis protein